jgi:hypothetical protein
MEDCERFRLLGKYWMPRFRIGRRVLCEVRGEMVITGMTDAPIPWPVGKGGRGRHSPVVYKGLAKAVRRESEQAVCHWFGVRTTTVWKWRKALGVETTNEGTRRLFRTYTKEPWAVEARAKAHAKARDPEHCRKIAEAKRGKPRLRHIIEAMRQARLGMCHTEESRRKMSETRKERGTFVPGTIVWTAEEDELLKTLPAEEVAKRTRRSLKAVYARRRRLGCRTDGAEIEQGERISLSLIVHRLGDYASGRGAKPREVNDRAGCGIGSSLC